MPEPIVHAPGIRYCRPCPIASCDWHLDAPDDSFDSEIPPLAPPSAEALALYDNDWLSAAVATTMLADAKAVEATIVQHFAEDHTLLDWVAEVGRLNAEANRLDTLGCQCPCHDW